MKVMRFLFPLPVQQGKSLTTANARTEAREGEEIAPRRRMMIALARRDLYQIRPPVLTLTKKKALMLPARRKKVTNSKIWNKKQN